MRRRGDKGGEFIYVGPRSSSVNDYIIENESCNEIVRNFNVDKVDSNHMSLVVELEEEGNNKEEEIEKQKDNTINRKEKELGYIWNPKAKQKYKERTESIGRKDEMESQ